MAGQVKKSRSQVVRNIKLNHKFNLVVFKSLTPGFCFLPGQFLTLKISSAIYRSYSLASAPSMLPNYEFLVDTTPNGPGAKFIKKLKPGRIVTVLGPAGTFVCPKGSGKKFIFASAGCGLAPCRSMIDFLLERQKPEQVLLLWGLRNKSDIVLETMLEKWSKEHKNFQYQIVLSQPSSSWSGWRGHVNEHLVRIVRRPKTNKSLVYLCGHSEFVAENIGALKSIGFPQNHIYFENY
jgi:NAD(P)H-flavin reductase